MSSTIYTQLLNDLGGRPSAEARTANMLLLLALRFIPGKHSIVDLPRGLDDRIVKAAAPFS